MKKIYVVLFFAVLSLSVIGCGDPCKESGLTKLGDSLATMGKKDMEKDKALMERKANRAAQCAEKTAGEMKKKMGF